MKTKMKNNPINLFFNSIFTKLILIFIISGICIFLLLKGFNRHIFESTGDTALRKSVVHYLTYIVQDLGNPPDLDRAKIIAQRSSLKIRYESPEMTWSTPDFPPLSPRQVFHPWKEYLNIRAGRGAGCVFVEMTQENGRFLFEFSPAFTREIGKMEPIVILTLLLMLMLLLTYFSIRWVLNPVKQLTIGVREVGKGNLDYRTSLKRSDELGQLAQAFNTMTDRIRTMLRAKEQLMLDVSHELRSPLTRMKLSLRLLSESRVKEKIEEDVKEMEKMVTQALDTARESFMPGQLNLQQVDIVKLIKEVLPLFKNQHPGVQIADIPDKIELRIDPDRVKSVIKNILDNAFKYSIERSLPVKISFENRAPYIIIRIQDNGIGIPADEIPFIFEPFYRVDKSRAKYSGGYGLGLSLCKSVMEAHQGKIEIESSPNTGTTVFLLFPA
jgi:signal transduction histidine kinase